METFKLKDKSLKELTHFPSVKVSVHNCMTKSEKDGELRLARASLPDETHAGRPAGAQRGLSASHSFLTVLFGKVFLSTF